MIYLALLRGINAARKVAAIMPTLKATFEKLGLTNVKTFINPSNVLFHAGRTEQGMYRKLASKTHIVDTTLCHQIFHTTNTRRKLAALAENYG